MKKFLSFIAVLVVILGIFLGYKLVYKISPRDFITEDTRIVYANENIKNKNFTPLLEYIENVEDRERLSSNLEDLKYVSEIYLFSDKEFYELNEKSFVGVVDTGYWYFIILKNINKYFDISGDMYILKSEIKERYYPQLQGDIFMKNYRGLFLLSLSEKNLKDFIAKDGKYLYNKEIEEAFDVKRDNLFGTLIYNNHGNDFYGVKLLINSGTLDKEGIISEEEIVLDEKENSIFKNTTINPSLAKFLKKNDIYISVDDFSKLLELFFNPLVTGSKVDSRAVTAIWKGIFGIDIEELLKEIDGEAILSLDDISGMIKIKDDARELKRFITMTQDENSPFYLGKNIVIEKNILKIGESDFTENPNPYKIDKGVFIYGEIDSPDIIGFEGVKSKIEGKNNRINVETKLSKELVKEFLRGY